MWNLLLNTGFETDTDSDGLADYWRQEQTAVGTPTFSLSAAGHVDGTTGQRIRYRGTAGDDGTKNVRIYQNSTNGTFLQRGDPVSVEACISGTVVGGAYVTLVLEAFDSSYNYLDEVETLCAVTRNPQPFVGSWASLPAHTDHVAVAIGAQASGLEARSTSRIDAVRLAKGVIAQPVRRVNYMVDPSFELGGRLATSWKAANCIQGKITYTLPAGKSPYGSKEQNLSYVSTWIRTNASS